MKLLLAFLLLSAKAQATPLYSENFESYSSGQTITFAAGANYRDQYSGTGNAVIATGLTAQCASMTASVWGHALYNALTPTGAISMTAEVNSNGRGILCVYCTTLAVGLPTDGYQIQYVANVIYLQRGGYAVTVSSTAATPANLNDYTIGVYRDGSANWTVFIDGVAKILAVNDGTYTSGQIGLGDFSSGKQFIDNIYVDDTTPTPTPGYAPMRGPSRTKDKTRAQLKPIATQIPTPVTLTQLTRR